MGACTSSAASEKVHIQEWEDQLSTGDIVMMNATELYCARRPYFVDMGSWTAFSHCGFVLKRGGHAYVCHSDCEAATCPEGEARLVLQPLFDELARGRYGSCTVRKLAQPLRPEEERKVDRFVEKHMDAPMSGRAILYMQKPKAPRRSKGHLRGGDGMPAMGCFVSTNYERFICSELVARMLLLTNRIAIGEDGSYVAVESAAGVYTVLGAYTDMGLPTSDSAVKVSRAEDRMQEAGSRDTSVSIPAGALERTRMKGRTVEEHAGHPKDVSGRSERRDPKGDSRRREPGAEAGAEGLDSRGVVRAPPLLLRDDTATEHMMVSKSDPSPSVAAAVKPVCFLDLLAQQLLSRSAT